MRVSLLLYDFLHVPVRFCVSISYAERVALLVRFNQDIFQYDSCVHEMIQDQVRGPVHGFSVGVTVTLFLC